MGFGKFGCEPNFRFGAVALAASDGTCPVSIGHDVRIRRQVAKFNGLPLVESVGARVDQAAAVVVVMILLTIDDAGALMDGRNDYGPR